MKIETKKESFRLYQQGAFGNKVQSWDSLADFRASGFLSEVTLRYKGKGGAWVAYGVEHWEVDAVVARWVSEGADPSLVAVNESAPDQRLVIQGEAMRGHLGLTLFYSTEKAKMRVALERGVQVYGLLAVNLLRTHCTPASYDDLMALLDAYSDSVVEFSVYNSNLGSCRGRNTVVWEVRNY